MNQPFSRVFCVPDVALTDSNRMRSRLGRYLEDENFLKQQVISKIEVETGARLPYKGASKSLDKFFQEAELRDVLDAISHVYSVWSDDSKPFFGRGDPSGGAKAHRWRVFVKRVFLEEHVSYDLDEGCNVRFSVDEAYAHSRAATLNGLQAADWAAPRAEFERAFHAMDSDPQDTNGAIRAISAAVESCVKILLNGEVARVGNPEIESRLWPIVRNAYAEDEHAANASHMLLKSLANWINGAHQYRHGQPSEKEVAAPSDLAIQYLTQGSGFIRWLIGMKSML